MNLVRCDPLRDLEDMSLRLNRLLAEKDVKSQDGKEAIVMADWVPTVDRPVAVSLTFRFTMR